MNKYIVANPCRLIEFLSNNTGLTEKQINTQLELGQVRINKTRIKIDCTLNINDEVEMFIPSKFIVKNAIKTVYIDDNIAVIIKPSGIEVEGSGGLVSRLTVQFGKEVFAVHRLDRNTCGIMVFALNQSSYQLLLTAFKNRQVSKTYYAVVCGVPAARSATVKAYLFKDSVKSQCYISDTFKKGYVPISTEYKLIKKINSQLSLLEVNIETGRTHQIRAHLAYLNMPILGDGKYGDNKLNKTYKAKTQYLASCKLQMKFDDNSLLSYLNSKSFSIDYMQLLNINELIT